LLTQWMEESEENKKYFGDISFVHNKAIASHRYVKVNTDGAWRKIKGQMTEKETSGRKVSSSSWSIHKMTWTRIAASFILIAGTAILFYILRTHYQRGVELTTNISSGDSTIRTLTGGTSLVLNRNSKLSIKINKKGRKKELTLSGEAFIEIKHSADTTIIVKAEGTLIKDIGTSFNVKAYPGSSTIEVFVESGEVTFYTAKLTGLVLTKGETGIFDKKTHTFRKADLLSQNIIAYKTHLFIFRNIRLAEAIDKLNSVYTEPIILGNPSLADCSITVTFDNENTASIADVIAETLGLKVEKTGYGYILNGERCINH